MAIFIPQADGKLLSLFIDGDGLIGVLSRRVELGIEELLAEPPAKRATVSHTPMKWVCTHGST
jgi:hypothetical protein